MVVEDQWVTKNRSTKSGVDNKKIKSPIFNWEDLNGKELTIYAGKDEVTGDICVVGFDKKTDISYVLVTEVNRQ